MRGSLLERNRGGEDGDDNKEERRGEKREE
jgi:hypothetical protein